MPALPAEGLFIVVRRFGRRIMQEFYELDRIRITSEIFEALDDGKPVSLTNVKGGLKGFMAMLVFEQTENSVLFVMPSDKEARQRYKILSRFTNQNIVYYPLEQVHDYFSDAHTLTVNAERLSVMRKVLTGEPVLVVTSMDALLKKLQPPERLNDSFVTLKTGEDFGLEHLAQLLSGYGYERVYQIEAKGQFSVRGGIVDVFPMTSDIAYRVEFFDDEIETIRQLDPATQRSNQEVDSVTVTPAFEILLTQTERKEALKALKDKYDGAERLAELLEKIETEDGRHDETLSVLTERKASFVDYMSFAGADPIVVWDDPTASRETAGIFLQRAQEDYTALSEEGEAFPEEAKKFFSVYQIERQLKSGRVIQEYLFGTRTKKGEIFDMDSRAIESFAGQPAVFEQFLKNRERDGFYIHFFCRDQAGIDKVRRFLKETEIDSIRSEDPSDTQPGIRFTIGEITEGFELEREKIVYLNETDFFRPEKKRRRRSTANARKIDHFTDLKIGDYVVHDVHGIGIYHGIEQMEIDGVTKDLMHIEYAGDASLYIPVEQMDSIQVYIGTGEAKPKISKMGSPYWVNAKRKAHKAVEDMADELIALYAKRRETKGYRFAADTPWQRDFEDAFPYEETDDQLRSIEEIKSDMESDIPMDRLLCGDVGYGKTEVAFRAAFKAAMESKQTAILVPTTVLAQQHYNSALERFKNIPVNIAVLSRFKTPLEQKQILKDVRSGKVDILIGTHRLLSKDVKFNDLGLLIIDEEQRFGVRSKEKIKQLKENIDVLTLSATPIPRTLHMSLSGVRDMSVLEEPPHGRRPVQTYVMNYSPPIIRDAIDRELSREGQVYFIHNRVHDIEETAASLHRLVPEARIVTAHGKMSGHELEHVMERFLAKEFDILVATTIVESGLDVKNANTLIVDGGDAFGLAQLYQLRGRVGRSDNQAYAYITHRKQILSEVAEKRLKAIRDFTAFGSGFKIALRDLEIRGAGNLLGAEQSGHLAKIGYELYTRILEETVTAKMTGEVRAEIKPVSIQMPIDAFIPDSYIPDEQTKYDVYSRFAYVTDWDDYDSLEEELTDRFGEIPQSVYNLMMTAMIKNAANALGITEINDRNGVVRIVFADEAHTPVPDAEQMAKIPKQWKLKLGAGRTGAPAWSLSPGLTGYELLYKLYELLAMFETGKKKS